MEGKKEMNQSPNFPLILMVVLRRIKGLKFKRMVKMPVKGQQA